MMINVPVTKEAFTALSAHRKYNTTDWGEFKGSIELDEETLEHLVKETMPGESLSDTIIRLCKTTHGAN